MREHMLAKGESVALDAMEGAFNDVPDSFAVDDLSAALRQHGVQSHYYVAQRLLQRLKKEQRVVKRGTRGGGVWWQKS